MTPGLELTDLRFGYAQDRSGSGSGTDVGPAVAGIDLAVAPGEILAVVGPSGSGKSTLLGLVSGLLQPTSGRVAVGGRDVTGASPEHRPVAMVFQGYALFPHLDVAANIGFGLAVRRVPKALRRQRIAEVAERLGLTPLLQRRPGELSGGERQRVALARALLRDPIVFCLDEPLSALDPVLRSTARRELEDLLRADGRCALHVTHDQAEAMTLGDRVALLRAGRIEQIGPPRELYDRPATTFVASFIGTQPMSLLPVALARVAAPSVVTVGVRAEHVQLLPGSEATVLAVDDLGHEQLVELDLGGGSLTARTGPGTALRRGDRTGYRLTQYTGFDAAGVRVP